MKPANTIVFDLGGVLVDWNPRYLYRKLFPGDDAGMERFLTEVATLAWNHEQDAGRPFAEGVRVLQAEHPAHADMIAAYWERWEEMLVGALDGTLDLFERLHKAGVPLYALTNWSAETFPIARKRFEFLSWFKGIVVSGDEGVAKPDPRIFDILAQRYSLVPATTVYLDDLEKNVAAAEKAGFIGHHFVGPDRLEEELLRHGFKF